MKCIRCKLVNLVNTSNCTRCYTPLISNSRNSNEQQGGIYRDNNLLVIELRASLPKRCYKCNSPNIVDYETQELEYTPYLQKRIKFVAKQIIPGAGLLPLTPGKREMELHLQTCEKHLSKRPKFFWFGAICIAVSILVLFLSARLSSNYDSFSSSYLTIAMTILFSLGCIMLIIVSYLDPVSVDKYRDSYFWVKGFNEEYLKSFPNLADSQKNRELIASPVVSNSVKAI